MSGEELLSLPYHGGVLIISPLTDLLANAYIETAPQDMTREEFYQVTLDEILGQRPQFDATTGDAITGTESSVVTVEDVLNADNYNPFADNNIAAELVSLASTTLGLIEEEASSSTTAERVEALTNSLDDTRGQLMTEADEDVLSFTLDSDSSIGSIDLDARVADRVAVAVARGGLPVVGTPNGGDAIRMTEGENFVLSRANNDPVSLFGFEDPFGNSDSPDDADTAREDGQLVGIYIEAASADGNIAVMFGDATNNVALAGADRVAASDAAISATTTVGGVTFYFVSEANLARLVLRPTDGDFNTADESVNNPQIRFYVHDGEHATVADGATTLDGVGMLEIEVANVNDAPVVTDPGTALITSTSDSDLSGTFTASDADGDTDFRWSATPTSTPYGEFSFPDPANPGAWTFTLNEAAFDALPAGMDVPLTFDITANDGNGGVSDAATLTIMLQGQNDAPTDITTSVAALVAEYAVVAGIPSGGIFITTLSTEDVDAGDAHSYTITGTYMDSFSLRSSSAPGATTSATATDNMHLWLDDDADARAVGQEWDIIITSRDSAGATTSSSLSITHTDANTNLAPTDITTTATGTSAALTATYDGNNVPDGGNGGHVVATLGTTDPNTGDTHTYSIVPVTGEASESFDINGNELILRVSASPAPGDMLEVTVRSTDAGGLMVDKTFTITRAGNADTATDTLAIASEGARAFLVINGVEFRAADDGVLLVGGNSNPPGVFFKDADPESAIPADRVDGVVSSSGPNSFTIQITDSGAGMRYSQARIAGIWNTQNELSNSHLTRDLGDVTATIVQVLDGTTTPTAPTQLSHWYLDRDPNESGVSQGIVGGTDEADLVVTEGTSDLTASGWLQVTGATGDITFSRAGGTGSVTVSGQLGSAAHTDTREYTFAGDYGDLVIDGDGDWVYTLGGTTAQNEALAALQSGGTERFVVAAMETGGAMRTVTETIMITVNEAPAPLAVASEGVREHLLIYGVEFRALEDLPPDHIGNYIYFRSNADNNVIFTASGGYGILTTDFSQANIANIWNTNTDRNTVYVATIIEEMTNIDTLAEWVTMEDGGAMVDGNGDRTFVDGTAEADRVVTEVSDLTASGWLRVTGGTGDITYGDGTAPDVTVTGTNTPDDHIDTREYTYAGRYGNLVIDGDGDWVYTLGGTTDQNDRVTALTSQIGGAEIFEVKITRGGVMVEQEIVITINGVGDAMANRDPVIDDFTGSIVDADPASDTNTPAPVSGTFSTASGSGTVETWTAEPQQGATEYGTISVTDDDWTFTLNAAGVTEINRLDAGETTDAVFDVTATNTQGSDESTLTISLTGIVDNSDTPAPVIGAFTGSIVDDDPASDTNAPNPVSGTFSTTSGTADGWMAVPQQGATEYGTIVVTGTQWTFTLNAAGITEINRLDAGETTDAVFDVTATNVGGSGESTLTISLTGIEDNSDGPTQTVPVIPAFTGSITDADPASDTNAPAPVSGTFSTTSSTADTWVAEPQQGATEYGTIVVTGAQWTFTLNAAGITEINRLDAGETTDAVFDVTATNTQGSDESTLTISLTGIVDNSDTPAPVIAAFTGSIADVDPASDTNTPDPVSGTFATTSGTADGWVAEPQQGATEYGTIVVTGAQWTFTLNAAGITEINRLDAGETTDAVFDVTATNVGGSAESTLTISLTGIVDNSDTPAPVIAAFTGSIADADPASDTNAPAPVSGTFSTTSGTADGWMAVPQQGATEYGTIVVTGTQWTFTLNAAGITEINRLDAGETTDAVFDVTATNVGGSGESTLTISLTGIVDNSDTPAPVIPAFTGSIADADPASDTNAPNPVSGTFSTTSGTADGWMAVPQQGATEYGTIVVTGTQWTFTLNAAGVTEINRLDAGETTDAVFDVTATNVGGSGESTLTISLTGIEDNSDGPTQTVPVIPAFTGSITDTDPASDTNAPAPVSGTFSTTSSTADTWVAEPQQGATEYGTIVVTGAQWTFTLNAAGITEINRLDAGETTDAVFDVTATNTQGSDESTLTISLTGIVDNSDTPAPVIAAFTGSIADADPASDTNAPNPVSGTFATTSGTADGWMAVPQQGATEYGTIVVTGAQWTFTLNAAGITEINRLDAGETTDAVFDVTATNVGGAGESTLTISLTGIVDNSDTPAPVIAAFTGSIADADPASDTNTPNPVSGTFATTSGTADGWMAVPQQGATEYGTIVVTGTQWTFTLNAAGVTEINRLDAGETTDAVFDVTATNVGGSAESTLTISLTGIVDNSDTPAPVIAAFTGSIADADPASDTNAPAPVSGTFSTTSGTADGWMAVPQQGATEYGTIVVTGTQWTFTLNAAGITEINRLDAGETTDAVFDVTATNVGGSAESTLTISLTGIVDNSDTPAPVIPAFTGSIADADPASDTNAPNPVSGTFATTSGTADGWMAVPQQGATEYGTIVVTGAQWTFTLNAAGITEINRLDAGETTDAVFDVTATNIGGSGESTLTISLTGIVDNSDTPAPVIPAFTGSIADADPASDTNAPNPVSGTFATTSGTADGWMAVPQQGATEYGTIVVTGTQWTFTLNAAGVTEINRLDAGETTDAVFDVTATNVGGSGESTLTISLTGIVDNSDTPAPVIAAFTGSIADADPASDTNAPAPVSGTFATTSGTADGWMAVPQQGATEYGTIVVTGAQWTFTLNAAGITEINRLDAGETTDAVFDVTATNVGGSGESTLTISLTGIVDNSDTPAPVIAAFTGSIADTEPTSDTNTPDPVSGTFATTSGTADGWMAVPQQGATEYGTIVVTGTQWTFTLNAAGVTEINRLDAGETTDAVFDVTATNVGGSAESTLTISLTGIDDNSDTSMPVDTGDASFNVTSTGNLNAAAAGHVLTVRPDAPDPDGNGVFTYRWQRTNTSGDYVAIGGATNNTYTIVEDDEGTSLRVIVSYTDGGGTDEAVETSAVSVPDVPDVPDVVPMNGFYHLPATGVIPAVEGATSYSITTSNRAVPGLASDRVTEGTSGLFFRVEIEDAGGGTWTWSAIPTEAIRIFSSATDTTDREFWVHAHSGPGDTDNLMEVGQRIEVLFNRVDIIAEANPGVTSGHYRAIPTDGTTNAGTGQNELFIGTSVNDVFGRTGGGTDVIFAREGDDTFSLGRNDSDVIYHRFSSSDDDWTNTDGGDTITNYVRSGANNANDTFIFVDTDTTDVATEETFIADANNNIRFYANIGLEGDVLEGFEIRFVNPTTGVEESTITINYHTALQPDITTDAQKEAFGILTSVVTAGEQEITDGTKFGHYFGDTPDAFQVINEDDLPPAIDHIVNEL